MSTPLLYRSDGWVKTPLGYAVAGAQVFVCTQPTSNVSSTPPSPLASIYSDPLGVNPVVQPIQTDGFGHYDFYVAPGTYTVVVAIGGLVQQVYPDQSLGLASASASVPGTGNGSLYATATPSISIAVADDIVVTDGQGNLVDSGVNLNNFIEGSPTTIPLVNKTGNYTLQNTDRGNLFLTNDAGNDTYTLPTPGALFANGWYFYLKNGSSTGSVVFTPTGATIDGLPSLAVNKSVILVQSDGANYHTVSISPTGNNAQGLVYASPAASSGSPFMRALQFSDLPSGIVVESPSADQTITADNLNPATSNTMQSLGLSTARWNASLGTADIKSMNGVLNATDFPGADIGAQVNNAIAALGTSGGQIYIPAGTYAFSNTIYLPPWVRLSGASATGTILNWTATTGWAIVVAGNNTGLFFNFSYQGAVEDMTLYGPGSATSTGGFYLGGSDGVLSGSGTVNTVGTAVTSVSGTGFLTWPAGGTIVINGVNYLIASVNSVSSITLQTSAGTQTGVAYSFLGSPLVANNPSTNQCFNVNFNRVRIVQVSNAGTFGIGFQWGTNSWSETFFECTINGCGTGAYFPPAIGSSNSGENIFFVGSIFGNNHGVGLLIGTGFQINVTLHSCSLDLNASWDIQNGTAANGNAVNMSDCYIFDEDTWISNYGFMSMSGSYFNGGNNSGTIGYLIDNQNVMSVWGGVMQNGGTGTILNTASAPSTWLGVLIQGAGGNLVSAAAIVDTTGEALVKNLSITTKVLSYNGFTLAGNGVPAELAAGLLPNQLGNFNGGTAAAIATTTTASTIRVSFSQAITTAASSSSTMPSLTLAWQDVSGVSRTKVLVATDSTNVTTAEHDGVVVITTNGTAATITSAGYASSGATAMVWALAYSSELL